MYFKYPHFSTIYMNNNTSFSNNLFLQWTGMKHYYFLKKNYSLSDQDSKGQQMALFFMKFILRCLHWDVEDK